MKRYFLVLILTTLSLFAHAEEKSATTPASPEPPVKFSFGGQAWVETESGQNLGYESSGDYFNRNATAGAQRQLSTLMTIVETSLEKGQTKFFLNFQVGELYFGDPSTGGSYMNKSTSTNPFYLRDAYISHNFNEAYMLSAGMMFHSADPNGYVMTDHMPMIMLMRHHGVYSENFWLGKMGDGKANAVPTTTPTTYADSQRGDSYGGVHFDGKLTEKFGYNIYGIYRTRREFKDPSLGSTALGAYAYAWGGLTVDYAPSETLKMQFTGISNSNTYTPDSGSTAAAGNYSAYLADARIAYTIGAIDSTLTFEGLATSGDNGAGTKFSDRQNFVSVSPKTSYLLTIACNDGADDAPGSPKQLVAPLDSRNGLNIGVVKLEHAFGKLGTFVRFGRVMATAASSTTKLSDMGDEFDFEATYDLDKSTQLQFDWAQFNPGGFYGATQKDAATILTTSLKFKF